MQLKLMSVIVLSIFFFMIVELVRREKLTFKYAFGWLILAVTGIMFSIFHRGLFKIAAWLGFELPSNFIFYAMMILFAFLSLLLTAFLCQQEKRNEIMAQKIALLEMEINKVKEKEK